MRDPGREVKRDIEGGREGRRYIDTQIDINGFSGTRRKADPSISTTWIVFGALERIY